MRLKLHPNIHNKESRLWIIVAILILVKSNILLSSIYSIKFIDLIGKIFGVETFGILALIAVIPILMLLSFSFLFQGKSKYLYIFIFDLSVSLLFLADIVYARAFGHLISVHMIFARGVTEDLTTGIVSLFEGTDILMLIDIPFLWAYIRSLESKLPAIQFKKRILQFVIAFALGITAISYQFLLMENTELRCDPQQEALVLSPIGAHIFDVYRFVYERNIDLNSEEVSNIDKWFEDNSLYQEPDKEYVNLQGCIKGKNIIVVQFESLENILINNTYSGQEITPNINRILGNSIYFNCVYEQVKDGNSSDAELMFNTSVYPISVGSTFLRYGDNAYNSLPKILASEDYTSIAVHGDSREFWNRDRVFRSLGFNEYIAEDNFSNTRSAGMGILDEALFNQSYAEITKTEVPFYCFIITLTSHMPFDAGNDLDILDLPDEDITSRYLQTISYADMCFGVFFDQLNDAGYLENSVIVIYGDHEGVHKYYPTNLPDNEQKIPFIIYIPGMKGMVIDQIGGQVDMMPTLVYLLGVEMNEYANGVMGRSLLGRSRGLAVLPDGTFKGEIDDERHTRDAQRYADLIIRGNYFDVQQKTRAI